MLDSSINVNVKMILVITSTIFFFADRNLNKTPYIRKPKSHSASFYNVTMEPKEVFPNFIYAPHKYQTVTSFSYHSREI